MTKLKESGRRLLTQLQTRRLYFRMKKRSRHFVDAAVISSGPQQPRRLSARLRTMRFSTARSISAGDIIYSFDIFRCHLHYFRSR